MLSYDVDEWRSTNVNARGSAMSEKKQVAPSRILLSSPGPSGTSPPHADQGKHSPRSLQDWSRSVTRVRQSLLADQLLCHQVRKGVNLECTGTNWHAMTTWHQAQSDKSHPAVLNSLLLSQQQCIHCSRELSNSENDQDLLHRLPRKNMLRIWICIETKSDINKTLIPPQPKYQL